MVEPDADSIEHESKIVYGHVMEIEEALGILGDEKKLGDAAYVIREWSRLTRWLDEKGVPDKYDDDSWLSLIEKVEWLVEHGES
jgi:hypothetical protein